MTSYGGATTLLSEPTWPRSKRTPRKAETSAMEIHHPKRSTCTKAGGGHGPGTDAKHWSAIALPERTAKSTSRNSRAKPRELSWHKVAAKLRSGVATRFLLHPSTR